MESKYLSLLFSNTGTSYKNPREILSAELRRRKSCPKLQQLRGSLKVRMSKVWNLKQGLIL